MGVNKRYYWLKLKVDFFNDLRIKKLRKIAGGDTYSIIYLKMLLSSLENDGYIYHEGVESDFNEEIALKIDEDTDNVTVTTTYLLAHNLIEYSEKEGCFYFNDIENVTGSETASTRRSRISRSRNRDSKVLQCNKNATTEIEIRDRDRDRDRVKSTKVLGNDTIKKVSNTENNTFKKLDELEQKNNSNSKSEIYKNIIKAWNKISELPDLVKITDGTQRAKLLNARLKEYSESEVLQMIEEVSASSFLKGLKSSNGWSATFDWCIKPSNFIKILEGNYKDKDQGGVKSGFTGNGEKFKSGNGEKKSQGYYKDRYEL